MSLEAAAEGMRRVAAAAAVAAEREVMAGN